MLTRMAQIITATSRLPIWMQSPTDKRWSQTQNYRSHDVLPRKEVPFGVRTMGVVIRGNMLPKLPKMALNGLERRNMKIAITPKRQIRPRKKIPGSSWDQQQTALRGWSNITQIQSNMAAGRHLEKNRYDVITSQRVVRFLRNLVGRCRMTRGWRRLCQNRNRI